MLYKINGLSHVVCKHFQNKSLLVGTTSGTKVKFALLVYIYMEKNPWEPITASHDVPKKLCENSSAFDNRELRGSGE